MTFTSILNSESGLQTQNTLASSFSPVESPRAGSARRSVRNSAAPYPGNWMPFQGIRRQVQSFGEGIS